jgi:hypothetical protein
LALHAARIVAGVRASPLLLGVVLGCAQPSLVERAIEARGSGPGAFTREVEARVHYGFPGVWRWEIAYRPPESFRFSLRTSGAPQHHVFDGAELRSYLGGALAARGSQDAPAFRSVARWLAVTSLDVLADPARAEWEEAPGAAPASGVARGLSVRFRDDGARYRLGFDAGDRLVRAEGPIEIPGVGAGRVEARFRDFRAIEGRQAPFAASYRLNGEPFFDERVIRFVPGLGVLDPAQLGGHGGSPRPRVRDSGPDAVGPSAARCGVGAGHFVKRVHTGIEYGLMAACAEWLGGHGAKGQGR